MGRGPRAVVLGVDSSTTGCKVLAFDREGAVAAEGRAPHRLDRVGTDGFEQDASAWWTAMRAACEAARVGDLSVEAVCLTHQRETAVFVDREGAPVGPAVVWMDKRSATRVAAFTGDRARFAAVTGKPVSTTPSVFKLSERLAAGAVAAAHVDGVREVHGFLAERLVGAPVTSTASAGPMGLVDLQRGTWARDLAAEVLGPVAAASWSWPRLVTPSTVMGPLTPAAAEALGLPAGIPVVAGAGDGQCAGLGAGITEPGRAYLNLGTAVVSGALSATYDHGLGYRTMVAAVPGHYLRETDLQGGTLTLTWLTETLLGGAVSRTALEAEAAGIDPGAEGLVLVPYLAGVMNPYWDDTAAGVLVGLRPHHGPAHFYRAALEGIALEVRLHLEALVAAGADLDEVVLMGGGSRSDLWCQILADVIGRPLVRAVTPEATALGAGLLAAVGAGWHPDVEAAVGAFGARRRRGRGFRPDARHAATYRDLYRGVYTGLYAAVAPHTRALWSLRQGGGGETATSEGRDET
ncbi:MAG: FGGY-family carbohydrate kinase [Myxococcota bacterium]